MKKLLALLMAVMVLTLTFTACSKKGEDANKPTQTETTKKKAAKESADTSTSEGTVSPDGTYEGEIIDISEIEALAETFNTSKDDEEKEAARIKLEKIIEQGEQQAQQAQ